MNTAEEIRKFITTNFYVADPAKLADDALVLDQGIIDSTGVHLLGHPLPLPRKKSRTFTPAVTLQAR